MSHIATKINFSLLGLALAGVLASAPAFADKPEWAGGGKDKHEQKHEQKHDKHDKHENKQSKHREDDHAQGDDRRDVKVGGYFNDEHRQRARAYYHQEYSGHCPPGLAKKNNGCMPPGQAKKYAVGRALPSNVVYYPVPQPMIVQLPAPPAPGYRYVRVGNDILLLSPGSSLVVDVILNIFG